MEGRRVSRRKPRRNPLYVIFMGLLAATLVLLIVTIVLGAKLSGARKELAAAQTKIEQLQNGGVQQGGTQLEDPDGSDTPEDGQTGGDEQAGTQTGTGDAPQTGTGTNTSTNSSSAGDKIDWLDLTGHSEVAVKPKSVYDKYYVYYTSDGVNLRSGPGTSYDKVKLVDLGTEVKAAAKQDGWTFVQVGDKFGWINSDYLSTTRPEPRTTSAAGAVSSGSGTGSTSGSSTAASGNSGSNSGSNTGSTTGSGDANTGSGTSSGTDNTASGSDEMPDWLKNNG